MAENQTGGTRKFGRIGVLLVNLGSPQATDYWSMRRYLRQFLSDKRVIEKSRLIWYPILHTCILPRRPQKSGLKYQNIWNYAANEPPLISFTRCQAQKLQQKLNDPRINAPKIDVYWAMRYGEPSIAATIDKMMMQFYDRLLIFPLYPQYSGATTASIMDNIFDTFKRRRFIPALRSVPSYPDDPAYINALAFSIKSQFEKIHPLPEILIASYHGLPLIHVEKGDPYLKECERTTRALRAALKEISGFDENKILMCFQSRFGREAWLQPYTDQTVTRLAQEGIKSISIINPGFVTDCLETIDEIGHEVARLFLEHGGKNFTHIPCLNDSEAGINVLEMMIRRELSGWL